MSNLKHPLKAVRGAAYVDPKLIARYNAEQQTLQSSASARILDAISEGEIEGLVNGLQSVYLDGTPIQNSDGTYNFSGVTIDLRYGTPLQPYIASIPAAENEISVNVEIKAANPVVRTIVSTDVDQARVTLSLPALSYSDPNSGNLTGTYVDILIEVQSNGNGFQTVVTDEIAGKSTSKYERSYLIPLTGGAPYDIRVTRQTPDSTSVYLQNRTIFESYTEIEDLKLRYPNTAIAGIVVQASQFSSIPSRAYDMKLLRIQIPSNYDPIARTYSGIWDGTFKVAWSDNPAWIFYDLVTNERYGLGSYISPELVDKWSLYQISQYCDETVDDGYGGTEPRFVCNLYLQSRAEAFNVMNNMASIFRGMLYWSGGALVVTQDAPSDPVYLFTPANVVDGLFTYQGAASNARHTVALVTWSDPSNYYNQAVEYVEDQDGIRKYGVIQTQVAAMGCTSRGQAHRLGQWTLLTEKYQSETITFATGIEAAMLAPGMVFQVADPVRAGGRNGGRIVSSTAQAFTVDSDITIAIDSTLTASILLPDGSVFTSLVQSVTGRIVTLSLPFTIQPANGSIWLLSTNSVQPQLFKTISVSENSEGKWDVTALAHNESKYDAVDFGTILEVPNVSSLSIIPSAPTDLLITETLYAIGKDVKSKITVSWSPVSGASNYLVTYQKDTDNPVTMPLTSVNDVEILNSEPGEYDFTVYAISPLGKTSPPATISKTILGLSAPPQNVQNFSLIPSNGFALLTWAQATDLDVTIGGSVRIRYSPNTVAPAWKDAVDVVTGLAGTATQAQVPLLSGTYMAKFVDASGNSSLVEADLITTVPTANQLNVVLTVTESPSFKGVGTNLAYYKDFGGLTLQSATLIDSIPSIDALPTFDFAGGVSPTGSYLFSQTVDLSQSYTSNLTAMIAATTVDVSASIDLRTDNVDSWQDVDGSLIDDVNAVLYVRTTNDNPSGTPNWSAWKPFLAGSYHARGFQFMLILTSQSLYHTQSITALSVTIDMPDRTVNLPGLTSSAAPVNIVFPQPFYAAPAIGVTVLNANSGDYYTISNKTNAGFTINFYNSSGTAVARTFDVLAKGYGYSA